MAHYAAELFVQCVYGLDLTYEELIATEAELKLAITAILEQNGAEFIHFEEMGDTMRVQCVFNTYGERLFHTVCDAFAPLMDGRIEARLLYVDKDLDGLHFYTISEKKWQEAVLHMPAAGPLTNTLRDQNPPSKKKKNPAKKKEALRPSPKQRLSLNNTVVSQFGVRQGRKTWVS